MSRATRLRPGIPPAPGREKPTGGRLGSEALHSTIGTNLKVAWARWDAVHAAGAKRLRTMAGHLMSKIVGQVFEPRVLGVIEESPSLGGFPPGGRSMMTDGGPRRTSHRSADGFR